MKFLFIIYNYKKQLMIDKNLIKYDFVVEIYNEVKDNKLENKKDIPN